MFGEPVDIDWQCNARLFIADTYGDNHATMRCQLVPGHEGHHQEQFERAGGAVTITWVADERVKCDHGCGQWEHDHREDVPCLGSAEDHDYDTCAFCQPAAVSP